MTHTHQMSHASDLFIMVCLCLLLFTHLYSGCEARNIVLYLFINRMFNLLSALNHSQSLSHELLVDATEVCYFLLTFVMNIHATLCTENTHNNRKYDLFIKRLTKTFPFPCFKFFFKKNPFGFSFPPSLPLYF